MLLCSDCSRAKADRADPHYSMTLQVMSNPLSLLQNCVSLPARDRYVVAERVSRIYHDFSAAPECDLVTEPRAKELLRKSPQ